MTAPPFAAETAACRAAQRDWADRPVRERLAVVRRFRQSLPGAADALTAAVERDVGRPPHEVLGTDLLPLADACRFLEKRAASILKPRTAGDRPLWLFGSTDRVIRRPRGVVAVIGTWNYPLFLNGVQIAHALTAGNGVLWKPSELSVASSELLHELFLKAGVPADLFPRLPSERDAGPQLLEADIDYLVFTGSAAVGRQIAKRLGERLIPSTLELSGCDALLMMPDADVAMTADAAWFGSTVNRGQTCIAVRRAFVPRPHYDEFLRRIGDKIATAGPMTLATAGQVRHADRLIADAEAKGGRVLKPDMAVDGDRQTVPRVVADATADMAVCREDCFAPLMAVLPYDDPAEAVRRANACAYGLGMSVFTRDASRYVHIINEARAGVVTVNDVIAPMAHPATPFGGVGASGWGTTQGAEGLLELTVPQAIGVRSGTFRPHYRPVTAATGRMLRGLLNWGHAATIAGRWGGLRQALEGMWASRYVESKS